MPQRGRSGSGRYPLEVKAVGVLQHGKFKHNMFTVLWSDRNDILIYRMFEDFKKLNRQLKKKFPLESGFFKKSECVLPKLKDVPIFRRNRNTNRFIERLRLLEVYSSDLLKTDGKISQSEEVFKFFAPSNYDLNPTFPENSLVIMPSDAREQNKEPPKPLPEPPAKGPIISQQYVCIEDYETKDTKNRPFKVKRNELLGVLIKESSGWWLVENEEKRVAWFPAPFLKDLESNEDSNSGADSDYDGVVYYASKGYEAMSSDELTISIGVIVEVMEKSINGWWLVRYNGRTGYVPSMYLKPYNTYQQLQSMITQGKCTSTLNLSKATSSLALNALAGGWRSQDDHHVTSTNDDDRRNIQKLDRRKSRSLYGLSTNMQRELASPVTANPDWTPIPKQRKNYKEPEAIAKPQKSYDVITTDASRKPVPSPQPQHPQAAMQTPKPKRDEDSRSKTPAQHTYDRILTNASPTPTSYPQPQRPQVPKRPKPHEILHKCTTVTKTALQAQAEPYLSSAN
ncbi:NADPH oxidase organizer 1-like [Spea bombifrons]|uniref:NADPH oxidase organizer 1-like n=1 Tax=Spea bombifrons TaxID=233779 RepID=UPI002349A997|nr:NADPH oxidase organizer 1-like [Spea bombifrons]